MKQIILTAILMLVFLISCTSPNVKKGFIENKSKSMELKSASEQTSKYFIIVKPDELLIVSSGWMGGYTRLPSKCIEVSKEIYDESDINTRIYVSDGIIQLDKNCCNK